MKTPPNRISERMKINIFFKFVITVSWTLMIKCSNKIFLDIQQEFVSFDSLLSTKKVDD
jgi:hypothetical protein